MKRKIRSISRIILALTLCASLSVNVFAESFEDTVDSSAGTIDITVSVKKTDDTTTTVSKTEEGGAQTPDGTTVNYEETKTSTVVKDSDGNEIGTIEIVDGKETTEKPAEQKDLNVDLIVDGKVQGTENSDDTNTIKAGGETTTKPATPDDKLQSEDPNNYNQITTTDRTAEITISKPEATTGDIVLYDENGNPIFPEGYKDGYDYYAKPTNYYDVNGNKAIVSDTVVRILDADGNVIREILDEPVVQRVVINKETGEREDQLYCADISTSIYECFEYRRANLEDAVAEGYYSEEEAKHLRAIAKYGYDWSDGAETGENLNEIKAMMKTALAAGDPALAGITEEQIDALTGSDAATATGLAVWKYGNRFEVPEGGRIEMYFGVEQTITDENGNSVTTVVPASNPAGDALFKYLISLKEEAPATETQIINEEKFVENMNITIGEMVKDNANNQDTNTDNDVYNVDLSFSLVVTPDEKNDDLIVKVVDSNGNVVRSARIAGEDKEGETLINNDFDVTYDENNKPVYTFKNLHLQENSNTSFNLKLEGAQLLEEGVYIYQAKEVASAEETAEEYINYYKDMGELNSTKSYYEHQVMSVVSKQIHQDMKFTYDKTNDVWTPNDPNYTWEQAEADYKAWLADRYGKQTSSQNFIGMYAGEADVNVNLEIDLTFDVKEGSVKTEREWYSYNDSTPPSGDLPPVEIPEIDPPLSEFPEEEPPLGEFPEEPPLEEIFEEDVPSDIPVTGDLSALWMAVSALSGAGLLGLSFTKKRDESVED